MHKDFFNWLNNWKEKLYPLNFDQLGNPTKIAIVSVDMIVGFCHEGPLASKEVHDIIPSVVNIFTKAHRYGVQHFLMLQDAHPDNAEEFNIYPPHCMKGTEEAENIPEIATLPFANMFTTFEKNAWSPAYDTNLNEWIKNHSEVETFILVGDCTDICVHATAMHLRMQANALQIKRKIIIPANTVATYDMSIKKAQKLNTLPHPAELFHSMFLYHMALNGMEIVKEII